MCFQFFPSTAKMFLIFQHFCVQMHLPIWFSHSRIITKHSPIVLSVIIFKILQHSSCDKCLLAGSDPHPRNGWVLRTRPKGTSLVSESLHAEGQTPEWRSQNFSFSIIPEALLISEMDVKYYFYGWKSDVF